VWGKACIHDGAIILQKIPGDVSSSHGAAEAAMDEHVCFGSFMMCSTSMKASQRSTNFYCEECKI